MVYYCVSYGCKNCLQLKWSLRQLLFRNSIKASVHANCGDFGNICSPILEFRSENRKQVESNDSGDEDLNNITPFATAVNLTDFQENVIYYMSGYICRKLLLKLTCNYCVEIVLHN